MHENDWQKIAPEVAIQILGKPNIQKSNEWRWGNKGSLTFNLETAQFYDFEDGEGGGVKWLLEKHGKNVAETLKQYGFDLTLQTNNSNNSLLNGNKPLVVAQSNVRSFSTEQVRNLYKQSIVAVKYSNTFVVMRFPEGHPIKQKYAPFNRVGNEWLMARPTGLLPIFCNEEHLDKPVILNEGEKAMLGCKDIYAYDSACFHGGVNAIEKQDWSKLHDRDLIIWCDNDEAGKKFGHDLEKLLKGKCTSIKVVYPPRDFNDKDDLWDAKESNYFEDSKALEQYIEQFVLPKSKGSVTFTRADEVLQQVTNPKWLIKDVCEEESLMCIFGSPKSGKSFIGIAMSCAIAAGKEFYGNKAYAKPVLYVCGEGQRGVKRRLSAWQQSVFDLNKVPLYLSDRAIRINDKDDFAKLEEEIKAVEEVEGQIGMIVIDTFQRNFVGNENSAEDVGNFINQLDGLISDYGCCVCLIHHSGHNNSGRGRGSSVIGASLDYEFMVDRTDKNDEMYVKFEQTLNKDGQGMEEKKFKFKEVEIIGEGLELTSGYLEITDVDFTKKDQLPYKRQLVLDAVEREAILQNKENPQDIWLMPSDLEGKVSDKDGNVMSLNSIKTTHLPKLVETGYVIHEEGAGYQSAEFNKLMPKFE
tara:strand:- start:1913 stop:3826 length:1914 start_codon:yes stop_codon:yes gene_type:complete